MHSTSPPTAIRLRMDAFGEWMQRLGLEGEAAQAEHIGIDRSILNRVRRGETNPGEKFIAACMAKSDVPFEALFEVTQATS